MKIKKMKIYNTIQNSSSYRNAFSGPKLENKKTVNNQKQRNIMNEIYSISYHCMGVQFGYI